MERDPKISATIQKLQAIVSGTGKTETEIILQSVAEVRRSGLAKVPVAQKDREEFSDDGYGDSFGVVELGHFEGWSGGVLVEVDGRDARHVVIEDVNDKAQFGFGKITLQLDVDDVMTQQSLKKMRSEVDRTFLYGAVKDGRWTGKIEIHTVDRRYRIDLDQADPKKMDVTYLNDGTPAYAPVPAAHETDAIGTVKTKLADIHGKVRKAFD